MNTSGTGLSGSQTFTANQATGATFTVASNATNANTASTIVARDASGNFSAGTITATLSGAATSATTAGTITSQANSATITATSANTASQIVLRDASGNFSAGTITASLSGNSTTVGGFTPSASSGVGSRVVVADGSGYIFNNYFNSTDNAISSGVTAMMSKQGDNYYRSASAAAVATFISGQSFNTTGTAANVTGTVAVANGGTGQTTGYKLFDVVFTSNINANTDRTAGSYGSYASSATNTPTSSGILYNFMSGTGGAGDGGQFWQDYANNNLYLRQRWGGGFSSWLTILSASNYNSYAPTLTGTGASGTWGISISGNAATATGGITTSNYTTYTVKRTGNVGNADLNSATYYTGSQVLGYNTATNRPGGEYGTMISINERGDTCLQLVVDYSTGNLFSRGIYTGAPTFSAWQTQISNTNYTSYAMPIGSSATNSVDVRAPIFYDSNDTTYYVDGNSISSLYGVAVRGDSNATSTTNQIFFWGVGTTTSAIGFKANGGYFTNPTGNGDGYNTYLTMDSDGRGWVFRRGVGGTDFGAAYTSGWILNNGIWQANASMRAPIFYDSNNTAFYADLAGTTNINTLSGNGKEIFNTGDSYLRINQSGAFSSGCWFGGTFIQSTGFYAGSNGGTTTSRVAITGGTYNGSNVISIDGSNGVIIAAGDMRAPIFYDQNNTGYYVDPASTSRMGTINADVLYSYGNVTAYSDERLKKDWESLPTNFVEELAKVKSGTYTRIDSGERQVGVGAQSLQAILKEAVSEKEEYLGVHYGNAAMVSAVELAKEVVDLRARVAQLESLISKLIGD
jgi:hypothetical protein